MSMRGKICPICNKNIVKNFYAKTCIKCRSVKGDKNPNFKGKSICKNCGNKRNRHNKTNLCGKCYHEIYAEKLPFCKVCGTKLSKYGYEYCQKCYKGTITKRWNPSLTDDFRKNGRTINPDYYKWRNEVFKRDNYTCQICNNDIGGNLNAHHLDSFAIVKELRTNINNGVTLCEKCHKNFHKVYGYFENTNGQYAEFLHKEAV
jgi:hypothetical protein